MTFLRLRQVCLVAEDLDAVEADLVEVLGLSPCLRDPHVAQFGLGNVLLPVGTSFIEIVSPIRDGTAAGRYLARRSGDGGYMAIFDSDQVDSWRNHAEGEGVRVAALLEYGRSRSLQLHPRDTGGPLLEINCTAGGDALAGAYGPAGDAWQAHVRTDRVRGIAGIEIQADDPERLAERWAAILRRGDPVASAEGWTVFVDNAALRFSAIEDGRGEGLCEVNLMAADAPKVVAAAERRGLPVRDRTITLGGVRWTLTGNPEISQEKVA